MDLYFQELFFADTSIQQLHILYCENILQLHITDPVNRKYLLF